MKKRIYALILGGIFAFAGCPLTSIAQTASTAEQKVNHIKKIGQTPK